MEDNLEEIYQEKKKNDENFELLIEKKKKNYNII
jgi:hypothetical protein